MTEHEKPTLESLTSREKSLTKHIEARHALALRLRSIEPVNNPAAIIKRTRGMLIANNVERAIEEKLNPRLEEVTTAINDEYAIKSALSYEEELTKARREFAGLERSIQTLHRRTGTPIDDSLYGTTREALAELKKRPLDDALLRRGLELQDRDRDREREREKQEQKTEDIPEQPQNGQKPAREQDEAETKGKGVKDKKGGKESKTYNVILPDGREIKTTYQYAAAYIAKLLTQPLTVDEQLKAVYGDRKFSHPDQVASQDRTNAINALKEVGLTIIQPNPSRHHQKIRPFVIVDADFKVPVISINLEADQFIINNQEYEFNEANIKAVKAVLAELARCAASAIPTEILFQIARDNGFTAQRLGYLIEQLRNLFKDNKEHPQIIVSYGKGKNSSYGLNARVFLTEKKPRLNPVEQTTMSKKEAATQDFNRGLITEDEFVDTMRGLDEPDTQIQPEAPAPEALPSAPEQPAAPEPTEAETLQAKIARLTYLRDRSMNIHSSGFLTGEKRAKLDETIQRLDEQIRQLVQDSSDEH